MDKVKNKKRISILNNKCLSNRPERKKSKCSLLCPVCTLTIRGEKAFKDHYKLELELMKPENLHLLSSKCSSKSKYKSFIDEDEEEAKLKRVDFNERCQSLKNIKKRKYERYSQMFLNSMSIRSKSADQIGGDEIIDNETQRNNSTIRNKNNQFPSNNSCRNNTNQNNETDNTSETICCAVCSEFLDPSNPLTSSHLSKCFAKKEYEFEVYSSSDDDDDVNVEEYSWAGQTWIRASSLLNNESLCEGKVTHLEMEDGDEELDIDGDEHDVIHGVAQFSEADVIPCPADDNHIQRRLREAVVGQTSSVTSINSPLEDFNDILSFQQIEKAADGDQLKLLTLLKSAFLEMDKQLINGLKCPICMGTYKSPVVSTSCWHVCCKECWMRTLGAKKLCPKCNNIVSTSHLRKIFM